MIVIYAISDDEAGTLAASARHLATQPGSDDEARLAAIADATLPAGTRYEIVDEADLPSARWRAAWRYSGGPSERIAGPGS